MAEAELGQLLKEQPTKCPVTTMLDGTEFLECACGSDEHTLRFTLSLDEDPEIYTAVFLGSYPWGWRRIWTGIRYLFGYKCKYGHWDCFIMKPEDAARLRELLDRLVAARAASSISEVPK